MLKIIGYIVVGLIILFALIYIAGLFLPEKRFASRKIIINATLEDVWDVVTNVKNYNNWRSDIERTEILIDRQGILVWKEYPKSGKPIKFIEKKRIENNEWQLDWEETGGLVSGYWIGKFTETKEGIELESNEYAILKNPFIRTLSYLFFDLENVIKKFQLSVKNHLEENTQQDGCTRLQGPSRFGSFRVFEQQRLYINFVETPASGEPQRYGI